MYLIIGGYTGYLFKGLGYRGFVGKGVIPLIGLVSAFLCRIEGEECRNERGMQKIQK